MTATNSPQRVPKPGRNHKGQFTKGNPGGPGNPFARQVAELRKALLGAVTPTILRAIADELVAQALGGKLEAIKLLFQYVLGQPTEMTDPDRVDVDEWKLVQERAVPSGEIASLFESTAPQVAIAMVETMQEARAREMQQMLAASDAERPVNGPGAAGGGATTETGNGRHQPAGSAARPHTRLGSPGAAATIDDLLGRIADSEEPKAQPGDCRCHRSWSERLQERNGPVEERLSRRKSPPASGNGRRADGKRRTVGQSARPASRTG
jgi:hypothetical protein